MQELDATEPLNDNKMSLLAIMMKHTVHKSAQVDCSRIHVGRQRNQLFVKPSKILIKVLNQRSTLPKKKKPKKQKNTFQNKNKSKNNKRSKKKKTKTTLEQSHKKQVALKLNKVQSHESLPHEERLPLRKSSSVGRNVFLNLWRVSLAK